jgi:hypothetical protein
MTGLVGAAASGQNARIDDAGDFDRLNTIDYRDAPIRVLVNCVVATLFGFLAARAWFGSSGVQREVYRFRHQYGLGVCILRGLLSVALPTAGATWAVAATLDFGAQHLSGQEARLDATVVSVQRVYTSKTPCRLRLTVRFSSDESLVTTCLKAASNTPLGPIDLAANCPVTVEIRSTSLGRVITGVSRRPPRAVQST